MNVHRALLPFFCLALVTAVGAEEWVTYEPKPGPGQGKHIVLIAGDEEYRSEEALPLLGKILSQRHGFKCTVLFSLDADGTVNPDVQSSLSGAHLLDSADAIMISLRFRNWPDEQMKHFVDAYRRGVPIIGLRTSTHAFRYPRDAKTSYGSFNSFGKQVLGEDWVSHWGRHKAEATRGIIEASNKDHAILRGVSAIFGDSDVYEAYPPADATILVRGEVVAGMKPADGPADYSKRRRSDNQEQKVNDPMMPVAWTRLHKNDAGTTNRVFCTTMGAATDLENEGLRRLIVNATYWALGLDVPERADVRYVDEFRPSPYSFRAYIKGLKPSDFALGKPFPPKPAEGPQP